MKRAFLSEALIGNVDLHARASMSQRDTDRHAFMHNHTHGRIMYGTSSKDGQLPRFLIVKRPRTELWDFEEVRQTAVSGDRAHACKNPHRDVY